MEKGENTKKNAAALEIRSSSKNFGRRGSFYAVDVMGSTSDAMEAIWAWAVAPSEQSALAPAFGSGDGGTAKWGPEPTIVIQNRTGLPPWESG